MARKVTLKNLAAQLKLSVTTVSRALKEGAEVRPQTIARVKKTASKSKITGDFLFSKTKEEKKTKKNGKPESVVNKDSEALV